MTDIGREAVVEREPQRALSQLHDPRLYLEKIRAHGLAMADPYAIGALFG